MKLIIKGTFIQTLKAIKMKNRTKKWSLFTILIPIIYISIFHSGYIRSELKDMPFGILMIDREKLNIPEIPTNWDRYPKDNNLSATQIWIDFDSNKPRHYAKVIIMRDLSKSYKNVSLEMDRYMLDTNQYYQTDLVISINYNKQKNKENYRDCYIEKIHKIDTLFNCYDWFFNNDNELIDKLDYKNAITILKNKDIDYE